MAVTIGVDVGTFETKGVLVEDGRILAEARRAHELQVPRPGWAEHDPEAVWWGEVASVSRELMTHGHAVAGLAVSAIGPCCLAVDEEGTPVSPGILYGVDTRATAEIAELNSLIGEGEILRLAGTSLTSQAVGPKVLWIRRNLPEAWARASRLHTATSFILERLTGAFAMDHYTAGSWAPLYDIDRLAWADDLNGICGPEMLPRLLWSAEVAGHVTARAARETGLPEGTPVTVGTIDAGAEALSVGVMATGDMMIMYGSTIYMIEVTGTRVVDPRLWASPWLFPGLWTAQAGLATSGTLTQWLRRLLLPGLARDQAFATLAAEAEASPPGAQGIVVLPYFSGERTPLHDPDARGVIFGLDLTHSRGDVARATLEGIAAATRHAVETLHEAGAPPVRAVAVGGGVRNAVWLQATSDMAGLDQMLPEVTLGAAYGDAFLAAVAIGAAAPGDIARWNRATGHVRARIVPAYDRHWEVFCALYERTRDLMAPPG